MFNVTVIKLRDLGKLFFKFIAIIIIIYILGRYFYNNVNLNVSKSINFNTDEFLQICLQNGLGLFKEINTPYNNEFMYHEQTEEVEEDFTTSTLKTILQVGFQTFNAKEVSKNQEEIITSDNSEILNQTTENQIEENKIIQTEVVTKNPLSENYNSQIAGVKIKNETEFALDEATLNPDNLILENNNDIIIFHTHTCESYTASESNPYTPTGNFRTTDLEYTVAKVGDELDNQLQKYGFNVNHNKTYHDYPSYTGSYTRSLATVEGILKDFKSNIIIDLHRDAIGSKSDYEPLVKIGEDYASQLMFVIGSNGGGLQHPEWQKNLQFALKIQKTGNEMYPGLFKPIVLRNSRYNQHLGTAACIIEVGATGNTLEESTTSMKYLAEIMNKALK